MRNNIELGIDIGYVASSVGWEPSVKMIADAGFTLLDYNPPINRDDWEDFMKRDLELFAKHGLRVHQTHCPFYRYTTYEDIQNVMRERIYEATVKSGAEFMVVHGDEFNVALREYSPEAAFEYNHNMFAPFVKRAEQDGVKIAFETVFADNIKGCERYCARAEELERLIHSFESDAAVCCWDFGHANVAFGKEQYDVARRMGHKLACTHVHDNQGRHDDHLLPYQGNIDWKEITAAFKEAGYQGQFVYELVYGKIAPELMEDYLNYLVKTAKHICSL